MVLMGDIINMFRFADDVAVIKKLYKVYTKFFDLYSKYWINQCTDNTEIYIPYHSRLINHYTQIIV